MNVCLRLVYERRVGVWTCGSKVNLWRPSSSTSRARTFPIHSIRSLHHQSESTDMASRASSGKAKTPAVPRHSASLVLVNSRNEVLMVQRNPDARSFGGVHVSRILPAQVHCYSRERTGLPRGKLRRRAGLLPSSHCHPRNL